MIPQGAKFNNEMIIARPEIEESDPEPDHFLIGFCSKLLLETQKLIEILLASYLNPALCMDHVYVCIIFNVRTGFILHSSRFAVTISLETFLPAHYSHSLMPQELCSLPAEQKLKKEF